MHHLDTQMPTLADLTGLPAPPLCPVDSTAVDVCVEGPSLAPLVHSTTNPVHWRGAAFMQYAHCMHDEVRAITASCRLNVSA